MAIGNCTEFVGTPGLESCEEMLSGALASAGLVEAATPGFASGLLSFVIIAGSVALALVFLTAGIVWVVGMFKHRRA